MPADFAATGGSAEMRASDADRDRVADVLRTALEDGRLTADLVSSQVATARPEDVLRIDQRYGSVQRGGR